jgi:predicted anti-sigma-YlaC factor YlaD
MTEHLDALTLNAWADRLLSPAERQRVTAHLAECGECRALAAGQAQIAQLLSRLPPEAPPPRLAPAVVAAVARRRRSETAWRRLATVSAGAALLGLVLVALAWPDVARLMPAVVGGAQMSAGILSGTDLTALLDVPAQTLGTLASTTFDWGSGLTGGAGEALLMGLVLLTGAAFGGLAQLLRPAAPVLWPPDVDEGGRRFAA